MLFTQFMKGSDEGLGIFFGLVISFRGREKDTPQAFAQIVTGRADEIAGILDE